MLREGGHRTRDARAFRIVHWNHISKPHPRHHLTSRRSPVARGAGLGLEVTERVPSGDLVPQPRKHTARRDQERQLLAIQSEAGNAERSGAKRSEAERSGAERSGAERSGNRDEPIKPDRFPRCTSATLLTYRRARTSECTSASEIRLGKYTR